MANFQDLLNIQNGGVPVNQVSQSPVVVVTNPNQVQAGCLPCNEDVVCNVAPTQALQLDLSRMGSSSEVVRFDVDTTASTDPTDDKILVFFPPVYAFEWDNNFPRLVAEFPETILGGAAAHNGDLVNGVPAASAMAEFNVSGIAGGASIGNMKIQYDSTTYPILSGLTITGFFLPPDPADGVETDSVLSPLCDFCTSNNNGNFTTHSYNMLFPATYRNGVVVFIPGVTGGVEFILDVCFNSNGIPNMSQDTWAHQNNGGI